MDRTDQPRSDFRSPRLHVEDPLSPGSRLPLGKPQAHYLCNVLRLKPGDTVLTFNGRDGEWRTRVAGTAKRPELEVLDQTRPQSAPLDLHYLFAPLKHERLDYVVQKAVEMGVSRLQPVITRHTQVARMKPERMRANAIEAAEQCGILNLPDIHEPVPFARMVAAREPGRVLVFCDEFAPVKDPIAALRAAHGNKTQPLAVLIGPEGGFSEEEREMLLQLPNIVRLSLGPRILRADTAAVAALALVQAALGDWT